MNRCKYIISLIGLLPSSVLAGSGLGTASNVAVQNNGVALFSINGTRTGAPSCATTNRFAFAANTSAGQNMLATLLTGYGLGRSISVFGDGTCTTWPDSENVTYLVTP